MAKVDQEIVRRYFEAHNFLVRTLPARATRDRKKSADDGAQLLVQNAEYSGGERAPRFFVFASELPFVHRAVVSVRAWGASAAVPGLSRSSAKLFRWAEKNASRLAPLAEGDDGDWPRLLVMPGIPVKEPFRTQTRNLLREHGVDGVLSFRAILVEWIERIGVTEDGGGCEIAETIRLLKGYDLIKDSQLELFRDRPE